MNREELTAKVIHTTHLHLGVAEDKVTGEARFVEDLGADSLDVIELVMAFEEEFGVEITDDETDDIQTVKQAIDLLESKVA